MDSHSKEMYNDGAEFVMRDVLELVEIMDSRKTPAAEQLDYLVERISGALLLHDALRYSGQETKPPKLTDESEDE